MSAIFISYRREDTEGQAGRLFDDLAKIFGEQSVFMDVAAIEPGRDFRKAIDENVTACDVLLAMIGRNWLDARDQTGRRRLDDPLDFVRLETAAALKRDIPVVPVLVQGASMPTVDQLPADLGDLAFRNAVELTHARWNSDLTVLKRALSRYISPPLEPNSNSSTNPEAQARPVPSPSGVWKRTAVVIGVALVLALGAAGAYRFRFQDRHPDWHFAEFPPPNAGKLTFTIMPDGNPACASYDESSCLWGVAKADIDFNRLKPLVCGDMHRAKYGVTGYEDPKHWCNYAKVISTAH